MSISSAVSSATYGMLTNLARFDASAARVAQAPNGKTDTTTELIDQLVIKNAFQANAAVLQTASDMERFSLQLWA